MAIRDRTHVKDRGGCVLSEKVNVIFESLKPVDFELANGNSEYIRVTKYSEW